MDLRPPDESGVGGGSSSGGAVRERDDGSLSSSAPSAFNGFQQFQQRQEEQMRRTTSGGAFPCEQQDSESADQLNKVSSQPDPLTRRLNAFRLQEIGCDVAFVVGEEMEQLRAHKLVLGASSPVFLAMFYGPLANDSSPASQRLMNPAVNIENSINNQQESTSSSAIIPNLQHNLAKTAHVVGAEEEEYEDEEYEDEEYEEEPDNLSNESSLTSSLEGEHHLRGVNDIKTFPNVGVGTTQNPGVDEGGNLVHRNVHSAEIPPPQPPHFHRQISHPFEGGSIVKRRLSISKPKNLGHKTVQSQGEHLQQLNFDENSLKMELAVKGFQMVRVPDCEPKAFAILIDFVYSDFDVNNLSRRNLLNEENVMNTLYAAKKYDIHPLVTECVRYCTARLTATNAVSLLAQARLLDENTLVEQCYQVIDQNTDIALHANAIADIDRDTLINVLGRNQLDPSSELVIFHAAKAWAEAECSRKHIQPTVENLRQCLGPAMQLIRFSLMDVNEFGQPASSSLLTYEEIAEVFLHLTVRPMPQCQFACQGFQAKKLQIRIAIQKVYDFLFDVYKKEKDLKIPYLIQNAGHYDGILQNLLDFSAEIPSFARVNERCKSTELVYEKAWPAKRTTNLLDGGLWNTENETKNRILERLFYPLCQIVDDLDSETLLGVYEKTLQFVKDQISTLRTLHGVQETTEGPTAKRARTSRTTEEGSSSAGTSKN